VVRRLTPASGEPEQGATFCRTERFRFADGMRVALAVFSAGRVEARGGRGGMKMTLGAGAYIDVAGYTRTT
jgi:hypothetical protein